MVDSEGKLYRRNRRHNLPVVESVPSQLSSDIDNQDAGVESIDNNTDAEETQELLNTEQRKADDPAARLLSDNTTSVYTTRSGRVIKPNPRYSD